MTRIRVHDRRAALVDAAVRVMNRGGVSAATTRAVVAEAGMSLASFHYAFTSRDEMMVEAYHRIAADFVGPTLERQTLPDDPIDAFVAGFVAAVRDRIEDPGASATIVELTAVAMRTADFERGAGDLTASRRRVAVVMAESWAAAWGMEWLIPVESVAAIGLSAVDGLVLQWLVERDTALIEREAADFARALVTQARPVDVRAGVPVS